LLCDNISGSDNIINDSVDRSRRDRRKHLRRAVSLKRSNRIPVGSRSSPDRRPGKGRAANKRSPRYCRRPRRKQTLSGCSCRCWRPVSRSPRISIHTNRASWTVPPRFIVNTHTYRGTVQCSNCEGAGGSRVAAGRTY